MDHNHRLESRHVHSAIIIIIKHDEDLTQPTVDHSWARESGSSKSPVSAIGNSRKVDFLAKRKALIAGGAKGLLPAAPKG